MIEKFLNDHGVAYEKVFCEMPGVPFVKINNQIITGPYTTRRMKRIFGKVK